MYRIVLLLMCFVLSGCGSEMYERMLRISPFESGSPDPKRTNLFPLYFAEHDRHAILWPLLDIDDKGFALRPLGHVGQNEWSFLWPLGEGRPKQNRGRVFPYYWSKDTSTLLGVYHWAPRFKHVGPIYWEDWDKPDRRQFGLFPVFNSGDTDWIGPFWANGREEWDRYGIFPLIAFEPGLDDSYFFPLVYNSTRTHGSRQTWLLGTARTESGPNATQWMFPLWWSDKTSNRHTEVVLPLFWWQREGNHRHLVTPFGGRGWTTDDKTTFVNVMGPLFHHYAEDDESFTSVAWPLYINSTENDDHYWHLFPLYGRSSINAGKNIEHWALLGALYSGRTPTRSEWCLWPLGGWFNGEGTPWDLSPYSLLSRAKSRSTTTWQFGASMLFKLRYTTSDQVKTSWNTRTLLFFTSRHSYSIPRQFPTVGTGYNNFKIGHGVDRIEHHSNGFMFSWFKNEKNNYRVWKNQPDQKQAERIRALDSFKHTNKDRLRDEDYPGLPRTLDGLKTAILDHWDIPTDNSNNLDKLIDQAVTARTRTRKSTHFRIPVIFEHQRDDQDHEWAFVNLFGLKLMNHKTEGKRKETRIAHLLYRSVDDGETSSKDIFPFIRINKSKKTSEFNWLHNFIHVKSDDDEGLSGHFLWIPLG